MQIKCIIGLLIWIISLKLFHNMFFNTNTVMNIILCCNKAIVVVILYKTDLILILWRYSTNAFHVLIEQC